MNLLITRCSFPNKINNQLINQTDVLHKVLDNDADEEQDNLLSYNIQSQ